MLRRSVGDSLENVYAEAIHKIDLIIEKLRTPVMSLSDDITSNGEIGIPFHQTSKRLISLKL